MTGIAWSKRLVKLLAVALVGGRHVRRARHLADRPAPSEAAVQRRGPRGAGRASRPPGHPAPRRRRSGTVRYRRAEATGTYDTAHEFVLYGRTQDSRAGNHLLTPLRLPTAGRSSWTGDGCRSRSTNPAAPAAAPPSGDVHVEGVLFASEGDPPGAVGDADARRPRSPRWIWRAIQSQLPYRSLAELPAAAATDASAAGRAPRSPRPSPSSPRARTSATRPVVHVRRDRGGRVRRPGAPGADGIRVLRTTNRWDRLRRWRSGRGLSAGALRARDTAIHHGRALAVHGLPEHRVRLVLLAAPRVLLPADDDDGLRGRPERVRRRRRGGVSSC